MTKKKLTRTEILFKKLSVLMTAKFATKDELSTVEQTVDLSDVSQATAAAIFSNYVFATTDTDQSQSGDQSGESGDE